MNAPRLKSISGVAFGSFAERFQQDLPASGLLLLDGENLETGGSSGSGKSTFIHALNYPFGTCKVPLTALQNWDVETTPSVTAVYEIGEHEVEVTRGKRFQLSIDGTPLPGSAKQKEEKLDELFGLDAEMRSLLTYRGQRKPGLFLSKTDAEKKDFLTKVLKLEHFELAETLGKNTIQQLEVQIQYLDARYSDAQVRLDQVGNVDVKSAQAILDDIRVLYKSKSGECDSLKGCITQIETEADRAALQVYADAQDQQDAAANALASLEQKRREVPEPSPSQELLNLRELEANGATRLEAMKKADREEAASVQQQRSELNRVIRHLSVQLGAAQGIMAQKDGVLADIEKLKAQKCPTCEREWVESEAKRLDYEGKLAELNGKLEDLIMVQESLDRGTDQLNSLIFEPNPKIDQMSLVLDRIRQQIAAEEEKVRGARTVELADYAQKIAEARTNVVTLRESVRAKAEQARLAVLSGIEGLQAVFNEYTRDLERMNVDLQQRQYELGQAQAQQAEIDRIATVMAQVDEGRGRLLLELHKEQDFELLRAQFLAAYFDDVLAEISQKTNAILGSIANTAHCTLEFTSERTTGTGKVKQEIVPVITINGHKTSLAHGPSGGMLSAIELAVDLAVGAVIARRAGVCPGWLILDESFDGLGPVEKKTCMEILQTYAHDRLVIVVDHMSETKGWFTQHVKIEYACGKSRIC